MTTTNTSNKQHNNDTGFSVLTATHVRNCQKKSKKCIWAMVIHSMMGIQTKWVCESPPKVGQLTHVFDHDTCVYVC